MDDIPHIGIVVRCLNHEIGRAVSAVVSKELGDSATGVQSWIVRYLYDIFMITATAKYFKKTSKANFPYGALP